MSDDAEEKPPKLKLSKDVRPAGKEEANAEDTPAEPTPPEPTPPEPESSAAPKPSLKLDRNKAASAGKEASKDFDPDDPFGDILPKSKKEAKARKADKKAEEPPRKSLELDRTKWQPPEEKKPKATTPPELPSKPAPRIDDGSGEKLSETLEKLPKDSSAKSRLPVASIAIILALILIIGAAGGGIWFVLKGGKSGSEESALTSTAEPETPPAQPTGPIGKAKEAVAKLEDARVEDLAEGGLLDVASESSSLETEVPTPPTAPEPPPAESAPTPPEAASKPADTVAPAPAGPSDEFKEQVSQFLSDSKIGGFRAGDKARVVLNGVSYGIGDEVEASTGLIFVGTKDGRLVFRDANGIYYVKSF